MTRAKLSIVANNGLPHVNGLDGTAISNGGDKTVAAGDETDIPGVRGLLRATDAAATVASRDETDIRAAVVDCCEQRALPQLSPSCMRLTFRASVDCREQRTLLQQSASAMRLTAEQPWTVASNGRCLSRRRE